ncbi:hypothetical protein [Halomonas beimenensis]|uniref:Uncharacterized protein n=1 Tax=Halomonas beimenensis TaxID=475662 RepID=A0A291P6P7_9GAMM|nr:hypothetical protein [Halomonas beimenensis]ATJ82583.1 hypothetical protein BEI_1596 [Halomonas beimenensis]
MSPRRFPFLLGLAVLLAGGGSGAIAPTYTSENPDIMRIGNERPADPQVTTERLGSYCLEITETWSEQGATPDGQKLWALDTRRKVVPCN